MAKKSFSEADLEKMGLVKQADGSFKKPGPVEFKGKKDIFGQHSVIRKTYIQTTDIVRKEVVFETPDFDHIPAIEWFIKGFSVPSKKNSRQNFVRNGKQISIPSKKHAEYVKMTAMQYRVFGNEFKKAVEYYKLSYPLYIQFTFVRSTKHSFDYCNACQTCEDIMKGHWIPDDSADYIIPVFKPYEFDKQMPGVKIKLLINHV